MEVYQHARKRRIICINPHFLIKELFISFPNKIGIRVLVLEMCYRFFSLICFCPEWTIYPFSGLYLTKNFLKDLGIQCLKFGIFYFHGIRLKPVSSTKSIPLGPSSPKMNLGW